MRAINIENLFNQSNSVLQTNTIKYIDFSTKELIKLTDNYEKDNDYTKIVEFLIVDTYNFNIYNNYIGLKSLYKTDTDWTIVNDKLLDSINVMYSNKKLYNILVDIVENKKIMTPFKLFIIRIIKSFQKKGIDKNISSIIKITNVLNSRIKRLTTKLNANIPIQFDKKIFGKNQEGSIKMNLNKYNYYYLINSVDNDELRKKIQNYYYQKTSDIMDDIGAIICLRNTYAKELGYDSYFSLSNKKTEESDAIFTLLESIAEKASKNYNQEINRIKKEGLKKNIDDNDIIYYHNKFQNKKLFCYKNIIKIIFNIIEKTFGLVFTQTHPHQNQC